MDDNGRMRQRFGWGDKGTVSSIRQVGFEVSTVFQDILHLAVGNRVWRVVLARVAGNAWLKQRGA